MPFGLIRMWITGLLAVAMLVGVVLLARYWYQNLPDPRPGPLSVPADGSPPPEPAPPPSFGERVAAWRPAADWPTAALAGALLLTAFSLGGGRASAWLLMPKRGESPRREHPGDARRVTRPDGTDLHVEVSGNPGGPTVVLTHGWGADATEWYYLRKQLGARYRLVAWDLPGLGQSKAPADGNYALDKLAADLKAVVDAAGAGGRVALLGHSIGGMITLTYAKNYPEDVYDRVAGLVLVHTTHTNPVKTTQGSSILLPLQKPVIEPLAHLMIGLSPVVRLMNVLSYWNGSMHWSNYKNTFSWAGTYGQVDFVSRYALGMSPAVYARGVLGMLRTYHATDALPGVKAPVLVVAAEQDKVCKPQASRDINVAVPDGTLASLSPAGHMGLLSSHEEFGRAVEAFLDRCHGRSPAPAPSAPLVTAGANA